MDSLFIVMPAYNEEENIENVVKQWYSVLDGKSDCSKLVIADSGSTDSTHDILVKLKKIYPKIEVLSDTGKQHGPKVIALYKYAISNGADYIFQTDSDGQTDPAEFNAFWNLRNKYDAILGYRPNRGDGKSRAFVERVVCFLLRMYFGVKVPDANAPFRLMKSSVVAKYIDKLPEDYNLPNIMMTTYFAHYHERLFFKEITFRSRQGGVNSINIPKIVKIGWRALGDFHNFRRDLNENAIEKAL
mgnify:CR=1 FL=1